MVLLSLNLFKGNWNSSELEEFVVMFNAGIGYIELRDALHPCLVVGDLKHVKSHYLLIVVLLFGISQELWIVQNAKSQ